jgi:Cadherin domain
LKCLSSTVRELELERSPHACDCADITDPNAFDVTSVHIYVTDENDNDPVVLFPVPAVNDTVQLSSASAAIVGHVITTVEASDSDLGVNSRLVFSMADENDLFDVDERTGKISVRRALPDLGEESAVTYPVKVGD